eukprot:scaffold431_cov103-Cylindrotheca_fusiformis.AAC.4
MNHLLSIHPMDLERTRPVHSHEASPREARALLNPELSARSRRIRNRSNESRQPVNNNSHLLAMTTSPSGSNRPVMIPQGRNQHVVSILGEALDVVYAFPETGTVDERSRRSTSDRLNGLEVRQ